APLARRNTRMSTDAAVALTGVRRCFGDVVAVDGLDFEVPRGTVTVLLGPNGAGKTTVVRLVTGALRANSGSIRTLGLDPDLDDDLLLLDEPTAGLDPESARAVLGLVDEMAEDGKTVLMCTHLLLEAEGLADQVIVMDHGRAVVAGSPAELSRRYWPAARVLL